jgi:carbamoyl-phosphate synthase large subunit
MGMAGELGKVMVIGSGPIIIGQAAEFDYSGTQACRALREEGIEVVLINSNPATIMTDAETADRIYIEPLTPEFAAQVIAAERPDGLLATLGGQTGLNLATELAQRGVLDEYGVRLLGTPLSAIRKAEDREEFRNLMNEIGEPIPQSITAETLDRAIEFAHEVGFPLIVRPAYTLGGTGGGIAHDMGELSLIVQRGLSLSMRHQVLVERCVIGWKEIEYEVMRDGADNCITVCNMENLDPMGIHTGDSIVIAPSQTLSDKEYQMLRTASLNIIRALGIEGGCNVQLALDPDSMQYYVIEVNPRVSRSSALASKATGYPIARVAAKIAIGKTLDQIPNAVTQRTMASFEPALDYVVVKIPRWPFDKFVLADRRVGTQMKATGEVMAIDRTFEGALSKAIRSLETKLDSTRLATLETVATDDLLEWLAHPTDERLFVVAESIRRKVSLDRIHEQTHIDHWFLSKIRNLVAMEDEVARSADLYRPADGGARQFVWEGGLRSLLVRAKRMGIADSAIGRATRIGAAAARSIRGEAGIGPTFKMVDTCAGEFDAATPYFYSTYEDEDEAEQPINNSAWSENGTNKLPSGSRGRVVVLGAGPIRIGQGIEFDYCSVHAVKSLRELGYESIIINNNPETVSTDFDTSDRLYFEPLTIEDVLNVVDRERPLGVIVQFGGQTAINLASPLDEAGVPLLGTSCESIDLAEDREKFDAVLEELDISRPKGAAVTSLAGAVEAAREIGYPVLVRPSYVLGGRAMEIAWTEDELRSYMSLAAGETDRAPILVDRYVRGVEAEVDLIADGEEALIPGVMEHIERAGVHSGDSMAVCPPQTLDRETIDTMVDKAVRIAMRLNVHGLLNIQYVIAEDGVHILEVNPRASRTVPYLSKITGIPMVKLATGICVGQTLRSMGYAGGLLDLGPTSHVAVKAPVFSFSKLLDVEVSLGPEMKSTGEIMGVGFSFANALYKALVASGLGAGPQTSVLLTIADRDKEEALPVARALADMRFQIYATRGTHEYLTKQGIRSRPVMKIGEGSPNIVDFIRAGAIDLLVNTISPMKQVEREGRLIRRASVEQNIPCITSLDTAKALVTALAASSETDGPRCRTMDEYLAGVESSGQLRLTDSRIRPLTGDPGSRMQANG